MNTKHIINIGILLLLSSIILNCGYYAKKGNILRNDVSSYSHSNFILKEQKKVVPFINPSDILLNNIFHPSRGKKTEDKKNADFRVPFNKKQANIFELTGIFRFQNTRGALIAIQRLPVDSKKRKPRGMYKLGDSLGDGYNLVEISDTQVVVARGREKITLLLRKKQEKKK